MKDKKIKLRGFSKKFVSFTNDGNLCHTWAFVAYHKKMDAALILHVNHLVKKNKDNDYYDFDLLREYKNYKVYQKSFSIKLSTLEKIVNWIPREF